MSHGIEAGLEIRGTDIMPPAVWYDIVPSVEIDEVPNRTLFTSLGGHYLPWLGLEPLVPVRGLPADVTQPLKERYDAWGGAAYDASWVTYEELVAAVEHMTTALAHLERHQDMDAPTLLRLHRGVSIDAVIAFLSVYHSRGFETRLVFWFTPI